MSDNPFAPGPVKPPVDPMTQVADRLTALLAAFDQLAAAVLERREIRIPAPVINVPPLDLSEVVNAVVGIKGPASAEEIAFALRDVLQPERAGEDETTAALLTRLAESLEKLDFRLKGTGNTYAGGGPVSLTAGAIAQLADAVSGGSARTGTWGYVSGDNGTVNVTGRVTSITAVALGAQGSFTINGGDTILLPYDSTDKASSSLTLTPVGALTDPAIVFDSSVDSYVIEFETT